MDPETQAGLRASRAMLGIVAASVAPALERVSLPHFRVLVLLDNLGPLSVTALAEHLGLVVSTFSRSLDRLEAGGWVQRAQGADDRRQVSVSITDAGAGLVQEVTAVRVRALQAVFARISGEDRAVLERAFTAFADATGEPELRDVLVLGI